MKSQAAIHLLAASVASDPLLSLIAIGCPEERPLRATGYGERLWRRPERPSLTKADLLADHVRREMEGKIRHCQKGKIQVFTVN